MTSATVTEANYAELGKKKTLKRELISKYCDYLKLCVMYKLNKSYQFIILPSSTSDLLPIAKTKFAWWRHQMETFSALLALCGGKSPVPGEFPSQRPVMRNFDVFFDLCLNNRLSIQSWGWWCETPSRPLWRHINGMNTRGKMPCPIIIIDELVFSQR